MKSQPIDVERLTAFRPRFFNETLKLRERTFVIDDFFPTLVAFCKLTQLVKDGAPLSLCEFCQFLNNFSGAHAAS